jgi:type IV secretion system protein VirB3
MSKNNGVVVDTLFVGATRPATVFGVTYAAFLLNVIVTMEAFVLTRNLFWLLIFIPVHGICYAICWHDPQTFDLFRLWGKTKGAQFLKRFIFKGNFGFWGASTYSPLSLPGQPRQVTFKDRLLGLFRKRNSEPQAIPINAKIVSRKEHV